MTIKAIKQFRLEAMLDFIAQSLSSCMPNNNSQDITIINIMHGTRTSRQWWILTKMYYLVVFCCQPFEKKEHKINYKLSLWDVSNSLGDFLIDPRTHTCFMSASLSHEKFFLCDFEHFSRHNWNINTCSRLSLKITNRS